jgi:hypothetical protein
VGVVVRPVPLRAAVPPAPGAATRRAGGVPRRELRRQQRRRARAERALPDAVPLLRGSAPAVAGRYGAAGLPATAFYDARGKLVLVHQGVFASEAKLAEEIERYALGGQSG